MFGLLFFNQNTMMLENLSLFSKIPQKLTVFQDYHALLCEPALLVKEKSFVTLYADFSFKQLKENALVKEFPLLLKGKSFRD